MQRFPAAGPTASGRRCRTVAAAVLAVASLVAPVAAEVVVVAVEEGSVAAAAGLRPGDVLREWVRDATPPISANGAAGELRHAFDWLALQTEQGRLGTTELRGERDGEAMRWRVSGPEWGAEVRPQLGGETAVAWQEGVVRREAGEASAAAKIWLAAATRAADRGETGDATFLAWEAGRSLAEAGAAAEADAVFGQALGWAAGDEVAMAALWAARGATHEQAGDLDAAAEAYRQALAAQERQCGTCLQMARTLVDLGFVALDAGDPATAATHFQRAVRIREQLAGGTPLPAFALNNLGGAMKALGDLPGAEAAHRRALAMLEALDPAGTDLAHTLNLLGGVLFAKGDLAEAERCYRRALAIREERVPESLLVAASVSNLAVVLQDLGRLDESETLHRRALALRERLTPESLDVAASLDNLASVVHERGDLPQAELLYRRALVLRERLAPDSALVAGSLSNLANVASDRGRLAEAEEALLRAIRILEVQAPNSAELAGTVSNLGSVARQRGELEAAEGYLRRALAMVEVLAPESPLAANFRINLGNVAWERGKLEEAEAAYAGALALWEKLAPAGPQVAIAQLNLGALAFSRGHLDEAEARFRAALAIQERLAPGSVEVATILSNLATVALARSDRKSGKRMLTEALAIQERRAPGSALEAELLHELGKLAWQEGHRRRATSLLLRAVQALETQMANLGGAEEVRAAFRGNWIALYHDLMRLLVERGHARQAYSVLERSRAQLLLALLAERDLDLSRDVPPEVEGEWRRVASALRQARAEAAAADPMAERERLRALRHEIQRLENERTALLARLRQVAPRAAELRAPRPLETARAAAALPSDAVLLAYSLGEPTSLLFVVTPAGTVEAVPLATSRDTVRRAVARLRSLIAGGVLGGASAGDWVAEARALYDLLVKPAEPAIGRARRIVIAADGALHLLPFAALLRGTPPQGVLVAWRPLSMVPSLSVLAELERGGHSGEGGTALAAFGDPSYPSGAAASRDPVVRSVLARTGSLEPLPGTRVEVAAIAAAFPRNAVYLYLGAEATEGQALSLPRDSRFVHFACHGFVDAEAPLESGLALSIPETGAEGGENGLLQAWEVLERFRVDAELVTLSACESGVGKEVSGEGLLGLTRAFQVAGARSVLASLWPVADESAAILMGSVYRALAAGRPKDEALRQAQLELLARPEFAAPFFWAAFQLVGAAE